MDKIFYGFEAWEVIPVIAQGLEPWGVWVKSGGKEMNNVRWLSCDLNYFVDFQGFGTMRCQVSSTSGVGQVIEARLLGYQDFLVSRHTSSMLMAKVLLLKQPWSWAVFLMYQWSLEFKLYASWPQVHYVSSPKVLSSGVARTQVSTATLWQLLYGISLMFPGLANHVSRTTSIFGLKWAKLSLQFSAFDKNMIC